jgi:hypothetical protein
MPVDASVKRLNCTIGCPVESGRTSECVGTVPETPLKMACSHLQGPAFRTPLEHRARVAPPDNHTVREPP